MADVKIVTTANLSCNETRWPIRPVQWSYSHDTDTLAEVQSANYFAGSLVRQGDLVLVKASDSSALLLLDAVTTNELDVVLTNTVKTATFA